MLFRLTNAMATFYTLINKVLQPFLNKFIVVYLDDSVVYSHFFYEHVEHLRLVFKALKQHELYVKKEKCCFGLHEVLFLGQIVGMGRFEWTHLWLALSKSGSCPCASNLCWDCRIVHYCIRLIQIQVIFL
ncbi:Uncharacterized protein TCM_033600, partial [Theobroma cacao]